MQVEPTMSCPSRLVFALCELSNERVFDIGFDQEAVERVERLWRAHGGDWRDHDVVTAMLAGVAQIAWRWASREEDVVAPPFALSLAMSLASQPRCLRIVLPDESRYFGVLMVWLRIFELLLPAGAPVCDLVHPSKARQCESSNGSGSQWLWGRRQANALSSLEPSTQTNPPRPRDLSCRIDLRETLV
jgi:hypothetical protein